MRTRMKHILILLGLLLFSMQLHARGTDNPVPEDGSREHPYLIEMSHGCEPYVHSGVYNEGYTAKLYLYYRLEVKDAPVIINLSSYSNVPLVTGIQMETGEELASAHVSDIGGGTGRIDKFPLMPGVYTILQSTHTHDVHITLTVEETLPPLPGGGDDKEEPDIDEPDSIDPYTPTQSMSYVRTLIPNESAQTKEELLLKGKSRHLIRYYDPLGRPFEEVARKASAAKEDVVALRTYDAFGRIHRQWLPVPSQNNGLALSPLVVSSRARSFYKDSATFSLSLYDGSPLGRLTEEYGPARMALRRAQPQEPLPAEYGSGQVPPPSCVGRFGEPPPASRRFLSPSVACRHRAP